MQGRSLISGNSHPSRTVRDGGTHRVTAEQNFPRVRENQFFQMLHRCHLQAITGFTGWRDNSMVPPRAGHLTATTHSRKRR